MHKVVIDASVVLKWIPGKNEEEVEKAVEIFKLMMKDVLEIVAPTFLLVEVLNILVRKRKLRRDIIVKSLHELRISKIKYADMDNSEIEKLEQIMSNKNVSAYDAQYLLLAQKAKCKLLTFDKHLLKLHDLTIDIDSLLLGIKKANPLGKNATQLIEEAKKWARKDK